MADSKTRKVVLGVVFAALICTLVVAVRTPLLRAESLQASAFFALMGLLALALAYQMPTGVSGNISFIPFLSALPLSPSTSLVLSIVAVVGISETVQRRELTKAVFNTAQYALAISVAILVYLALGGQSMNPTTKQWYVPQFIASYTAFLVINTAAVSLVIAVAQSKKFLGTWRQVAGGAVLYDLFAIPVVYGFGYVFQRWGPIAALGVAVPLFGLRQLYKTNYQLETLNQDLLRLIVSTVEARDPYTSGHSERVAAYSGLICAAQGTNMRQRERTVMAALLHDVGKIHEEFAPILRKPGRLTAPEYEIMKTHSAKGAALVAKVTQFADLVPLIRAHHESWCGTGYPDGLVGHSIPFGARVITIADTIDAMSTDRPYREGMSSDRIRAELIQLQGAQFDPQIIAVITTEENWRVFDTRIRREQQLMRAASSPRVPVAQLPEQLVALA